MFKNVNYDAPMPRRWKDYSNEYKVVVELNKSDVHKSIELEYGTEQEAINTRAVLVRYIRQHEMPLKLERRRNLLYVIKKEAKR